MIKVLIVDDVPETRDHLTRLLGFEEAIDVAGTAASGEEAIQGAMELRPDVVVMDINMPGMDGIAAAELISERLPSAAIIMMSVHGEAEHLQRAIRAGAREFLVKPFSSDEFATSIRRVYEREVGRRERLGVGASQAAGRPPEDVAAEHQVIAVFSPKGGAGRTTVATNLAVALHRENDARVCLVDANLQFGDVGVLLNLNPKTRSVLDAVEGGEPDAELLNSVVINHSSGIRVLLAPPAPESADLVTPAYLRKLVDVLRINHEYVVVDLPATLNDHSLAVMDAAD
ncbi:MAG: response regulator, partial [Chloroflexota bacterium]|nr:response regulator [Chloroflexota bacterium]